MYEFIQGKITELNPTYAVIENAGVGYIIHISLNTYTKLFESKENNSLQGNTRLMIHQVVREDAHVLFGFSDKSERDIFRLLISVSGIGPNTARMILSSLSPEEVSKAIVNSEVNRLKSIKGIGIKTAQRIIVDLKDKMSKTESSSDFLSDIHHTAKEESLSALISLGFAKNNAEKVIGSLLTEDKNQTVEELIKKALQRL